MNTPFIQIVYEEIEEYGLYDHKIKLFNLMEAALNGASGKARKEIDELWLGDSRLQGTVGYTPR